jgi:hypothetical protein
LAIVIGAWAVLWAIRIAPGRSWGALLPGLVAFTALLVAFPLLTAASEGVLGFAIAAHAEPAARDGLRAETLGVVIRPLAATVFALGALIVATLLSRLRAEPRANDVGLRPLDVLAALVVLAATAVGLVDLLLLRGTLGRSAGGAALLPRAETLAWVATACAAVLIGVAAGLGIVRGLGPSLTRT